LQSSLNKNMKIKNMTTLPLRKSIGPPTAGRGFLLIPLVLAWFALSPAARAVLPAPDGGYPGANTAEGDGALFSLTTGAFDTANGFDALRFNTTGFGNTAIGATALNNNTTGNDNTATGLDALQKNTEGTFNTANGVLALFSNTTGGDNTAIGEEALSFNTTGGQNTAIGVQALADNTTGSSNIALGLQAGLALTTGDNNIDIGNKGVKAEANTIRIGTKETHTATFIAGISGKTASGGVAVYVNANGKLGTTVSSARFKEAIKPMDKASEAIHALKPVTFRYKQELDPEGIPQFGLVAEQVEKVNPDLVARDDQGKVYTVRYDAVNAMLLNEFLKEHRKGQEQDATIADLKSTIAEQQKQIEALIAGLRKVSAQLELNKPAPQMVLNNQ
jgi:Chaperone of endosialidase